MNMIQEKLYSLLIQKLFKTWWKCSQTLQYTTRKLNIHFKEKQKEITFS